MCENGADLFELGVGDPFECQLSMDRLHELKALLLEPPTNASRVHLPDYTTKFRCRDWCNAYTCKQAECTECHILAEGSRQGCDS